jgi:hypothetical protein
MAQGRRTSLVVEITPQERRTLETWQRSTTIMAGLARRGRIVLMLADGVSVSDIARTVGMRRRFIYKWAQRFTQQGLAGLSDKPGRGRSAASAPRAEQPALGTLSPWRDGRHDSRAA